jgi:hypothetical protein
LGFRVLVLNSDFDTHVVLMWRTLGTATRVNHKTNVLDSQ